MSLLKNRKPLPLAFMILSVLYFIYVVSLGSSRMIGDEIGGDPGGMLLPLVLSIFMFIASTILFITDRADDSYRSGGVQKSQRGLFILTIVVSILYVALMRYVGFLITTNTLLVTLTFAYMREGVKREDLALWGGGAVGSLILLVLIYSIGRRVTRYLLLAARQGVIPKFLGSTSMAFGITLVLVGALFTLVYFGGKKLLSRYDAAAPIHALFQAGFIAMVSTELLYLIFRQLFLVELVRGLITW